MPVNEETPAHGSVEERLAALPADVRELVYSADMSSILQDIQKKHGLHIDQIELMEAETSAVMIGLSEPEQFVENLANSLDIDQQKSAAIVADINAMIFVKVRDSLKKLYGQVPGEGSATATPAPTPATIEAPKIPSASEKAAGTTLAMSTATTPAVVANPSAAKTTPSANPTDLHTADTMLQTPTASTSATYKVDPYREPLS